MVMKNDCTEGITSGKNQCFVLLISIHGTEKVDFEALTNATLRWHIVKMVRTFNGGIDGLRLVKNFELNYVVMVIFINTMQKGFFSLSEGLHSS